MSVTFQPAASASSDISLTVRSFAPNMPSICRRVHVSVVWVGLAAGRETYHGIDQIPVDVRNAEIGEEWRAFPDEGALGVASVWEQHISDEQLSVWASALPESAQDSVMRECQLSRVDGRPT